ncbi:flagella assembly protein FlgT middle domain-containing protein, partial [Marinobacter sp. AC-23]|uniref:flagella assembly protein FlgT middle domain-containing protein n=1 Tax=Marinobacter sp. AC-23 TaxID=1879031 RepID=UPI0026776615
WDTDYGAKVKRALFSSDTSRNFELDMIVHDGYTGRVIMEKRYSGSGRWDVPRNEQISFGSPRFFDTAYGQAVEKVLGAMTSDVIAQLDCQPMLVPITEVIGKDLLLEVGTPSGCCRVQKCTWCGLRAGLPGQMSRLSYGIQV